MEYHTLAVFQNFNRNVYIRFAEDDEFQYFIRLHTGMIEIAKLSLILAAQLRQTADLPEHAAKVFLNSTLEKEPRAARILELIRDGKPLPRYLGLDKSPVGDVEPSGLSPVEKMKVIGEGAAAIARRGKKDEKSTHPSQLDDAPAPVKRPKKAPRSPQVDSDTVSLASICAELKIDPSDARKAIRDAEWPKPESGRWEWPKLNARTVSDDLKALMVSK